ncbi:MAG: hypothetical protein U0572_14010 [Phycisphaerales bacterium]
MTSIHTLRRGSLLLVGLASLCAASVAVADDVAPPSYRGQPLTILAKWEFATPPTNQYFITPDTFTSIAETGATIDEVPPHAEISSSPWGWVIGDGNGELHTTGGPGSALVIAFKLPNWLPPHAQMPMRVQVTYSWPFGGAPGIVMTTESVERLFDKPPGASTLISYPGLPMGGQQIDNRHYYKDWMLVPSWHFNVVVLTVPFGVGLDEVVIDTGINRIVPANDDCTHAIPIGEGLFAYSTLDSSTDGPALPQSCDEGFGTGFVRDIWYRYHPSCDGTAFVTLCDPATNYDTRLAVYSGGCDSLQLVACNDDLPNCEVLGLAGYDLLSTVTFDVDCGQMYWVRVGGYPGPASTGSGTGNLYVACLDGTPCPACVGDLDGDNMVNGADLAILLGAWGPTIASADLNGDGKVDAIDLGLLLGGWGVCP